MCLEVIQNSTRSEGGTGLPVNLVGLAVVDAGAESVEVSVCVFILDHKHLEQLRLVCETLVQIVDESRELVVEGGVLVSRRWFPLRVVAALAPGPLFNFHSCLVVHVFGLGPFEGRGFGLELFEVVGHFARHHFVEHGGRNIGEGLTEGLVHLLFHLSLVKAKQGFALLNELTLDTYCSASFAALKDFLVAFEVCNLDAFVGVFAVEHLLGLSLQAGRLSLLL